MPNRVALVDYLSIDDPPHLLANECTDCGARYFDHRNACAACFGSSFRRAEVASDGVVRSFTIVASIVDCHGTSVRANLVNVEPDPGHVTLGMKVRLTTFSIGMDSEGTEAIGFGFEPLEVA